MNTEFVTVPVDLTAGQAITRIRETANEAETIYYTYVTDEEDHLLGFFLSATSSSKSKNTYQRFYGNPSDHS